MSEPKLEPQLHEQLMQLSLYPNLTQKQQTVVRSLVTAATTPTEVFRPTFNPTRWRKTQVLAENFTVGTIAAGLVLIPLGFIFGSVLGFVAVAIFVALLTATTLTRRHLRHTYPAPVLEAAYEWNMVAFQEWLQDVHHVNVEGRVFTPRFQHHLAVSVRTPKLVFRDNHRNRYQLKYNPSAQGFKLIRPGTILTSVPAFIPEPEMRNSSGLWGEVEMKVRQVKQHMMEGDLETQHWVETIESEIRKFKDTSGKLERLGEDVTQDVETFLRKVEAEADYQLQFVRERLTGSLKTQQFYMDSRHPRNGLEL